MSPELKSPICKKQKLSLTGKGTVMEFKNHTIELTNFDQTASIEKHRV